MIIEITWASIATAAGVIFGAYKGVCFLLDRYQVGDKRKQAKLLRDANRNMMRELIRQQHREFTAQTWIDDDELEHCEKIYETYHQLGGNGTATRWMEELRKLPRSKEV